MWWLTRSTPKEDKAKDANKDNKATDKDLDTIFSDVEHKDEKNEGLSLDQKKQLEQKKKDRKIISCKARLMSLKALKLTVNSHGDP